MTFRFNRFVLFLMGATLALMALTWLAAVAMADDDVRATGRSPLQNDGNDPTQICFPMHEARELLVCIETRDRLSLLGQVDEELIQTLKDINRALAEQVSALEEELSLYRQREQVLVQQVLERDGRAGAWKKIGNWLRFGAGVAVGGGALYLGSQIAEDK